MAGRRTSTTSPAAASTARNNEVDSGYNAAIDARRMANEVIAEADKIIGSATPPTPPPHTAQTKAAEAKADAASVLTFVDTVATEWEAYFTDPADPSAAQSAGRVKINAGKATSKLQDAQKLLEEARQLAGGPPKSAEELIAEIEQFREKTNTANEKVKEVAGRIRDAREATPAAVSQATMTAVEGLVTDTANRFSSVLQAEADAKAVGAAPTAIRAAHGSAQAAAGGAENNVLNITNAEVQVGASTWITSGLPPTPPTDRERAEQLAKSEWGLVVISSVALVLVLFIEYFFIASRLPRGDWRIIPVVVFLAFAATSITYLVRDKGWNRGSVARQVTFHVGVLIAYILLGVFNVPGSEEKVAGIGHGPDGDIKLVVGGGTPMVMWVVLVMLVAIVLAAIIAAVMWYRSRPTP